MQIIKKYGEIIVSVPNWDHVTKMRLVCDTELEKGLSREDCNNLYEVYYYLKTGQLSGAWRKINNLKEDIRLKVPGEIYDFLKGACKETGITVY